MPNQTTLRQCFRARSYVLQTVGRITLEHHVVRLREERGGSGSRCGNHW